MYPSETVSEDCFPPLSTLLFSNKCRYILRKKNFSICNFVNNKHSLPLLLCSSAHFFVQVTVFSGKQMRRQRSSGYHFAGRSLCRLRLKTSTLVDGQFILFNFCMVDLRRPGRVMLRSCGANPKIGSCPAIRANTGVLMD